MAVGCKVGCESCVVTGGVEGPAEALPGAAEEVLIAVGWLAPGPDAIFGFALFFGGGFGEEVEPGCFGWVLLESPMEERATLGPKFAGLSIEEAFCFGDGLDENATGVAAREVRRGSTLKLNAETFSGAGIVDGNFSAAIL